MFKLMTLRRVTEMSEWAARLLTSEKTSTGHFLVLRGSNILWVFIRQMNVSYSRVHLAASCGRPVIEFASRCAKKISRANFSPLILMPKPAMQHPARDSIAEHSLQVRRGYPDRQNQ